MCELTSSEAESRFDDFINETYDHIRIGDCTFFAASILFELDRTAYDTYFSDWLEKEGITINDEVQA
jgi:hypothetical protein